MGIYELLVNGYNQVLAIFPPPLRALVTLLILIGLVFTFINLVKSNWLWLILVVLLLPVVIPILGGLIGDIWNFFLYLLVQVGWRAPAS